MAELAGDATRVDWHLSSQKASLCWGGYRHCLGPKFN